MRTLLDFADWLTTPFKNKQYWMLAVRILLVSLIVILGAFVLVYILQVLIVFFSAYGEVIVVGGIAFCSIVYFISEKRHKHRAELSSIEQQASIAQENADKALLESNYIIVRQCVYSVLCEIAENLGLTKPQRQSEIDSPSRIITNSNVLMYQFVVLKKSAEISISSIKEILQTRITQKLIAHEFSGLTQSNFVFGGTAYPILCVHDVADSGAYINLDIVWFSEAYGNLLHLRKEALLNNLNGRAVNIKDTDF